MDGGQRMKIDAYGRAKNLGALSRYSLFVMLPDAPGLSRSLPADKCYFDIRFDWEGLRNVTSCFSLGWKS
jgi:hypothetical protein